MNTANPVEIARKRLRDVEKALVAAYALIPKHWTAPHDERRVRVGFLERQKKAARESLFATELAEVEKTGRIAFRRKSPSVACGSKRRMKKGCGK